VNLMAIQVLKEIGIDISGHASKHMDEFSNREIITVITVCSDADQVCPVFPGQVNRHHWGFDDPARTKGTAEEILAEFRRVRDQIRLVLEAYAAGLADGRADEGMAPIRGDLTDFFRPALLETIELPHSETPHQSSILSFSVHAVYPTGLGSRRTGSAR
jgi:hypothetical protein